MKPVKFQPAKILVFLLVGLLLQSCTNKPGSWKNDAIKAGKREDFHELNDEVFKGLKANDPKQLNFLMSKELLENSYTNRSIELISNRLNDDNYRLLDEYYVINKFRDYDTIKATGSGNKRYGLNYPGITKEMYIGFFVPAASENKYMITIAYGKYDYGWKISKLDLAPYTINGKTAPELFNLAKSEYEKNYLIDAVNEMSLASTYLKPSEYWQYPQEEEINEFYGKVLNEANEKYKFPFTLTQIATKPRIIRVYNETVPEGSYPMIYYLSAINLKDTVAIKKENENIRKVIGTVMPGIDKNKKYVFYAAFNTGPGGGKTVEHFDITDTLP